MAGFAEGPGDGGDVYAGGDNGGLIGALVQTGGALYDSYQNRKAAKENTDKTIAASKSEAELAYQRSLEQWNRQNQYNSPQAQMQRFVAAGLNPHLIYGQGNSGNASTPPAYQPANMQYRYESGNFGASVGSILPTLMSVGSWLQGMRATEAGIQKTVTENERARQMVEYLTQKNPKELERLEQNLSLYPYQSQMKATLAETARMKMWELNNEFRYKYGDDLWRESGGVGSDREIGGLRKLQFLQEQSKTKLLDAKSSWSDFNITDPQQIMQLVLNGVMGLAGQTLRLSTHKNPSKVQYRERPRGLVRRRMGPNHPDR